MQVFEKIEDALPKINIGFVVSIGNFDGVHIGHKALIENLVNRSKERKVPSVILTFEPHPFKIIAGKCPPVITPPIKQKLELLQQLGVDITICLEFTKDLADIKHKCINTHNKS